MGDGVQVLADLCGEAARLYCDDWEKVFAHVREQLSALPASEREKVMRDLDRVLRYLAPPAGSAIQ